MIQVDYISARLALIAAQKSSPYELGLGWTVDLDKPAFIGRQALLEEHNTSSPWLLAGVRVDWDSLESLYAEVDLYPSLAGRASRQAVPVYRLGRQVGQITSHTFSPVLKNYIGLASIERKYARIGDQVEVEFTIEYARKRARASLVKLPFFNPTRKRA
jgi:aminomethyltransferase